MRPRVLNLCEQNQSHTLFGELAFNRDYRDHAPGLLAQQLATDWFL